MYHVKSDAELITKNDGEALWLRTNIREVPLVFSKWVLRIDAPSMSISVRGHFLSVPLNAPLGTFFKQQVISEPEKLLNFMGFRAKVAYILVACIKKCTHFFIRHNT